MLVSRLWDFLPLVVTLVAVALALFTSVHAVLHKRDPRAAVSWSGLIWLVPLGGALLYLTFGINRVARRAANLRRRRRSIERRNPSTICTQEELREALTPGAAHLGSLAKVGDKLAGKPLLEGNRVTMLVNGEQAYPQMLQAIGEAKKFVALEVYIIELDETGRKFVDALIAATKRGCRVLVLMDSVGSQRSVARALRDGGVTVTVFLPILLPFRHRYMNLRNHRKILVCDGAVGFTGGMNIRDSHLIEKPGRHHEQDTHFRLEGPVVEHLTDTFVDDWAFATGEVPSGPEWTTPNVACGPVNARGIAFDPGENLDVLRLLIGGAIAAARRTIRIVSPYFIPEQAVITALNVAALRGVKVDILIPVKNDSRFVQWATTALLWQVLINGCRVWLTREPFDHSKLMVVDEAWVFFGSANMDTRSMRLNFEFNVEVYDLGLAGIVTRHIDGKLKGAKEVTLKEVDNRILPVRLRDGIARLFSPYL
ncbi:MAG TPA: cardiolipin synthase [Planctomycetota bacterium]|nr:cardiolipin synthase [Planctomycetota bacterium]